jgi:hypothetical protein
LIAKPTIDGERSQQPIIKKSDIPHSPTLTKHHHEETSKGDRAATNDNNTVEVVTVAADGLLSPEDHIEY